MTNPDRQLHTFIEPDASRERGVMPRRKRAKKFGGRGVAVARLLLTQTATMTSGGACVTVVAKVSND